jgi:hypothetical protein
MDPTRPKYRLLPDLTAEERESLKKSIEQDGVQIPAIVDEEGNIVDGHHRDEVCRELGIFCPREVRKFNTESEKWELALTANVRRRQLDRQQKRDLIAAYLRVDPEIGDNWLAEIIGGVSKNTVMDEREKLEAACQIDKVQTRRGKDGKRYPAKFARIVANTARELETALRTVKDLPPSPNGKIVDTTTAARRARMRSRNQELEGDVVMPTGDEDIRVYHCPFQEIEQVAGLAVNSVQQMLADIPYGQEFIPQVPELAALASRLLVDGGTLVLYSGQYSLDEVMRRLGEHLTYRWAMASVWDGDGCLVHPLQVLSQWKPVLVYSKGDWQKRGLWPDVLRVNDKEKDWDLWQQPVEEAERLVRYFTRPGDLTVDPCGGGFTTAIACRNLGRRFVGCDIDKGCVLKGQARLAQLPTIGSGSGPATLSQPSSECHDDGGRE